MAKDLPDRESIDQPSSDDQVPSWPTGSSTGETASAETTPTLDHHDLSQALDRYWGQLITKARENLRKRTRVLVDSDEVIQSVYASFLINHRAVKLKSEEDLREVLLAAVVRHCNKWNQRQKRHPSISLYGLRDEEEWVFEIASREPTPSEVACFEDILGQLKNGLNPNESLTVDLLLQGFTPLEVSVRVGMTERAIRRYMQKVWDRLQHLSSEER